MAEKRFQWIYIKDNILELRDNGIVKVFNNERLEELLNKFVDENEQLKQNLNELNDENEKLRAQVDTILSMIKLSVEEEILKSMKGEEMYPANPEGIDYGRDWND